MTELSSVAEINANKAADTVPETLAGLQTSGGSLALRLRGCYITEAELTSPTSGKRIPVLYADSNIAPAKITATHTMLPAGPYDGLGGQHGFPRWADYAVDNTLSDNRQLTLQARQTDHGLHLTRQFILDDAALISRNIVTNTRASAIRTSIGEHLYFLLDNEQFAGLKVDGHDLNGLFGDGTVTQLQTNRTIYSDGTSKEDGTVRWLNFAGQAVISFPAGYSLRLSVTYDGDQAQMPSLWIWHRVGTPSICFEPIIGAKDAGPNDGVELKPADTVTLSTRIELL